MTLFTDALWNVGWRAAVLLTVLAIGVRLFPRHALAMRSVLLQLSLWSLLVLPLTLAVPHLSIPLLPGDRLSTTERAAKAERNATLPTLAAVQDLAGSTTPAAGRGSAFAASAVTEPISIEGAEPIRPDQRPAFTLDSLSVPASGQTGLPTRPDPGMLTWSAIILAVYLTGVLILLVRLVIGLWQVRRLHQNSQGNLSPVWEEDLLEYCRVLHIAWPVRLRVSPQISTPLTFGWWRPVVVVPATMIKELDQLQRRAVLLHELTHIQRGDFVAQLAMHIAQVLYWYQPLAWLLGRDLRASQENLCDAECSAEFGNTTYSSLLVQIVQSLQPGPVLTLTLAMSRRSRLARRLTEIQSHTEETTLRLTRTAVGLMLVIAIPLCVGLMLVDPVRAQIPPSPADILNGTTATAQSNAVAVIPDAAQKNRPVPVDAAKVWPDVAMPRVVVKLQDAKDQAAIAGALVQMRRLNTSTRLPEFDRRVLDVTSDEHGVIACAFPDLPDDTKSVFVEITVPGRAVALKTLRVQKPDERTTLATVDLWPGQELSTRVYDANGKPADDARVQLLADIGSGTDTLWSGFAACDPDGRLTTQIPKGCAFGLTVTSERGAPYRVVLPAGTERISEIYLTRGSVVAGQLLDRDGKPVPRCDIVLEAEDSQAVDTEFHVGRHGTGSLDLEFQRTTDEQGRFRFPPMSGQVRVYLNCESKGDLRGQLIPVSVDLPASGETWLPLMLSPTSVVSGTARWKDGSPVKNLSIELLIPPRFSRSYITLGAVQTDGEGHYKMPVPFPVSDIRLTAGGMRGPDQKYWVARPLTEDSRPQSNRMKQLTRYVGESLTVDWLMTPDERETSEPRTPPQIEPAWQPLVDLELEIKQVMSTKRDAREVMMDRCLAFEEQHRGTRLGIGALHYVMRAAETTMAREPQQARERAIKALVDHYLKHPDVDMLITRFDAGSGTLTGEPLLLRLVNESPFDYVRATALLELARHRLLMRHLKEGVYNQPEPSAEAQAAMIAIQKSEETKTWLRDQYERGHQLRAVLGKVDGNALQQSAIELLERLTTHYIGVAAPVRYFESAAGIEYPELMLVDRVEIPTWRRRTAAEQAEMLRFQITRLQPGMNAPEIEGLDLQQRPIRLSQFRGQVVLLTLTLGNTEQKLYAECARIIRAVKDPRFACVSVIPGAGSGGYSARAIVEDGKVTWPIIRDTTEDDIAHLWCQKTFPAVYLIDAQGVIQHVDAGDHSIPGILGRVQAQMELLPKRPQPAE